MLSRFLVLAMGAISVCDAVDHLVPVKRSLPSASIGRRTVDYSSYLRLQTQTELLYSHPWDDEQRVVTALQFHAHPDRRILMLEDIDHLTQSVKCLPDGGITIKFINPYAFEAAKSEWATENFILITSHDGCGEKHQRTPYHVSTAIHDPDCITSRLETKKVDWTHVGGAMDVQYGHEAANKYPTSKLRIRKRQDDEMKKKWAEQKEPKNSTFAFDKTFEPRQQLYPPTVEIPDTNTSVSIPDETGFQFTCVQCYFKALISVGGSFRVEFNSTFFDIADSIRKNIEEEEADDEEKEGILEKTIDKIGDFIEVGADSVLDTGRAILEKAKLDNLITFENASMSASVEGFEAGISLEIFLEKKFSLNRTFDLIPFIPLSPFTIPSVVNIGPQAGVALKTSAEFTTSLNFTSGIELALPGNASVEVDLLDLASSNANGWDKYKSNRRPFVLNAGKPSVTFTAALQPFIELAVSIGPNIASIGAGLTLNLPQLSVTLEPVANVTKDCEPRNETDFETYSGFTIDAMGDISLNVDSTIDILSNRRSILPASIKPPPIFNFTQPIFETKCLAIGDKGIFTEIVDMKPEIDFDGLAKYVQDHDGELPPNLNATNVVDAKGYDDLPKDIKEAVQQKSEEQIAEKSGNASKKSAAVRSFDTQMWRLSMSMIMIAGVIIAL